MKINENSELSIGYFLKPVFLIYMYALTMVICQETSANRIVYPGRSCPAITKAGLTLDILYENLNSLPVDSIILEGQFNKVVLPIESLDTMRFIYDLYTQASVNNKITVIIPESTPEELYGLVIKCSGSVDVSPRSVKVVKKFQNPHRLIHISDPHFSRQWVGSANDGYAKELELFDRFVEVANIIAPDFVVVTGDLIHDYTRLNADSLGWGGTLIKAADERPSAEEKYKNCFEGAQGLSGLFGLETPVFSVPGNHDYYGMKEDDYHAKSKQWNCLVGKRVYGFSYGATRILAADDYLGDPVIDIPDHAPMSGLQGKIFENFLKANNHGDFRIMIQHRPNRIDTTFLNKYKINLLLNGHNHTPFQEQIGKTPIISARPGTICRSGEIRQWEEVLGFFRLIVINGTHFELSKPLRFCKNPTLPYQDLELNLTLKYKKENNGKSKKNTVVLNNQFDIDLSDCKIRFVMPKGKYQVSNGHIYQIIETPLLSVLDVKINIDAMCTKKVRIYPE